MIRSADQNLVRLGLHELDGGNQVVNDAGRGDHRSITESSKHSSEPEAVCYVESVACHCIDLVHYHIYQAQQMMH
jgi:hypothetical protein